MHSQQSNACCSERADIMVIFCLKLQEDTISNKFIEDTNARLKSNNFIKNPFNGQIKKVDWQDEYSFYIIYINNIIYPKIYQLGILFFIVAVFFAKTIYTFYALPGLIMASTIFLYNRTFYYFIFKLGLKKQKYSGYMKLLSTDESYMLISKLL